MLKLGGHILLRNICLVPVCHLAMRTVLHLVLLARCIAVKDDTATATPEDQQLGYVWAQIGHMEREP